MAAWKWKCSKCEYTVEVEAGKMPPLGTLHMKDNEATSAYPMGWPDLTKMCAPDEFTLISRN